MSSTKINLIVKFFVGLLLTYSLIAMVVNLLIHIFIKKVVNLLIHIYVQKVVLYYCKETCIVNIIIPYKKIKKKKMSRRFCTWHDNSNRRVIIVIVQRKINPVHLVFLNERYIISTTTIANRRITNFTSQIRSITTLQI